ncbi:MAG: PIN domain-containing protein [Nitrospirota bacterium]|jgi:Predicted nucleic acid-binding protein, contains PIN domain|nr:PIN domain-containing protein [Nitrospirota bacterium]MDE3118284.1 PIN domain-containing protein [Nitrospirota bacterium]MDE3225145.1 PIN domain-containing protein [Nitrospirota bacterium]MDE3244051.1 PIN domain-containing protein [Nitrospirota bacterium]
MELKRWRVFLDTSALIAGIASQTGAAREVLRLAEARLIEPVLSRQVLTEADRNIAVKLPTILDEYHGLLEHLAPMIVEDPSREAVQEAARVIHRNDAPILAAAKQANVDFLVTWNTRDFLAAKVRTWASFPVMTPGEFLRTFREALDKES